MDRTCFAYSYRFKDCNILNDHTGCGPDCPFRKSPAEFEAASLDADQRLARLPQVDQQHIAETYYGGRHPWLETARKATSFGQGGV